MDKIVFGSIFKLYNLGSTEINLKVINDFWSARPSKYEIYKKYNGDQYIINASENNDIETLDYYYNRVKKMTLLRAYDDFGLDISFIYDVDNIMDIKKKEYQENFFDNHSAEQIAEFINEKLE